MVHIGNNPPNLDEIADLLTSGDIITHCYNGKPNRILTPGGELRASVARALRRGVRLDVGHGSASFSFAVAKHAIALGICRRPSVPTSTAATALTVRCARWRT